MPLVVLPPVLAVVVVEGVRVLLGARHAVNKVVGRLVNHVGNEVVADAVVAAQHGKNRFAGVEKYVHMFGK